MDEAWAAVEAVLPEGLTFSLTRAIRPVEENEEPTYYATASRPWTGTGVSSIEFQVAGPTPTAALQALAAKLSDPWLTPEAA